MTHEALEPFAFTAGPRSAKLVFVGEAHGAQEANSMSVGPWYRPVPLCGAAGAEFQRMLHQAWPEVEPQLASEIERALASAFTTDERGALVLVDSTWLALREQWLAAAGVLLTNVFAFRPRDNRLEDICCKRQELPHDYQWPPLLPKSTSGSFVRPEYLPEVDRLYDELASARPNLSVALGNTACWALLRQTAIGSLRGAVAEGVRGGKVLPTYHPAGVLRQWAWRPIVIADLMKARREAEFAEIRRPERKILINPSLWEVHQWIKDSLTMAPAALAVDIETHRGQIVCIGFARSRGEALVVPFIDRARPGWRYWTEGDELAAWLAVGELLHSEVPKVFQNGVYDLQYLLAMGFRPKACLEDTMLLHHSLFPEMPKALGFLGSIYTAESSWKLMRRAKAKEEGEKRDE